MNEFKLFRYRWWGLILLHALLWGHLAYYITAPDKGNSTSFRVLALGVVGFSCLIVAGAFWITPARLAWIKPHARPVRAPFIIGSVGVLFVFGLGLRPEWIYPHIALTLAASFGLIYWTLFNDAPPLAYPRVWLGGLVFAFLVVLFVRAYGLSVYPSFNYTDEPIHLAWTVSYNRIGELTDWVYLGGEGFEGKSYIWIPRYYVPYSYWIKLVGVGMWEGRLYNLLVVLLTTIIGSRAAYNLYGRSGGLFAFGALLASATLMVGARIRHDIGLGLAITCSLWLYSEAIRRDKTWLHMLAGMAMALGMLAHLHATGLSVVMVLALYAPRYVADVRRGRWWPEKGFWLYILGGLVGLGLALMLQTGGDIHLFMQSRSPRNPKTFSRFLTAWRDHVRNIYQFSQMEFVLILIALGLALWRRLITDWTLIIAVILGPVALASMASVAHNQLIVPLAPLFAVLIGVSFAAGVNRFFTPQYTTGPSAMRSTVFLLFIAAQLGATLALPVQHLIHRQPVRRDPPPAVAWVLENVEPGSTVVGEYYHFWWLYDYRFVAPRTPSHLTRKEFAKYGSVEAVWDAVDPDVFILDPSVGTYGVLTPLIKSGYFESRGYEIVAKLPYHGVTMTIYMHASPTDSDQ